MIVSSADGGGGVGGDAAPLFGGEEESDFGGDGVRARKPAGKEWAIGGLRDGSKEDDGESSTDNEAKAASRSLEW
jgi:hypothetical protein